MTPSPFCWRDGPKVCNSAACPRWPGTRRWRRPPKTPVASWGWRVSTALRSPIHAGRVHGDSGLGGAELPPNPVPLAAENAIPWLAQRILAEPEPVTLVPIGPLTNIALLLAAFPEVRENIERIVLMGGSMGRGNVTPCAEFNIFADPEAAKMVFHSGVPVAMVGLDVTRRVIATRSVVEKIRGLNNSVSEYVSAWLTFYGQSYRALHGSEGGALHDPLAVATLIHPDVVRFEDMYVDVETRSNLTYGQTVCYPAGVTDHPPNVKVAVDVCPDLFWDILFDALHRY
jgi:inosine-uridine nucleoside N-ribohydrolase